MLIKVVFGVENQMDLYPSSRLDQRLHISCQYPVHTHTAGDYRFYQHLSQFDLMYFLIRHINWLALRIQACSYSCRDTPSCTTFQQGTYSCTHTTMTCMTCQPCSVMSVLIQCIMGQPSGRSPYVHFIIQTTHVCTYPDWWQHQRDPQGYIPWVSLRSTRCDNRLTNQIP